MIILRYSDLFLPSPYDAANSIPFYLNPYAWEVVAKNAAFFEFYREQTLRLDRPKYGVSENYITAFFNALDGFEAKFSRKQSSEFEAALKVLTYSGCNCAGNLLDSWDFASTDGKKQLMLPVERFYYGPNYGSGRHVRLGYMEIKGSGRNVCSVRSDHRHGWGGMDTLEGLAELFYVERTNSIAPLGAVDITFLSFVGKDNQVALIAEEGSR